MIVELGAEAVKDVHVAISSNAVNILMAPGSKQDVWEGGREIPAVRHLRIAANVCVHSSMRWSSKVGRE